MSRLTESENKLEKKKQVSGSSLTAGSSGYSGSTGISTLSGVTSRCSQRTRTSDLSLVSGSHPGCCTSSSCCNLDEEVLNIQQKLVYSGNVQVRNQGIREAKPQLYWVISTKTWLSCNIIIQCTIIIITFFTFAKIYYWRKKVPSFLCQASSLPILLNFNLFTTGNCVGHTFQTSYIQRRTCLEIAIWMGHCKYTDKKISLKSFDSSYLIWARSRPCHNTSSLSTVKTHLFLKCCFVGVGWTVQWFAVNRSGRPVREVTCNVWPSTTQSSDRHQLPIPTS